MGLRLPRRYWLTGAGNGIGASLAEAILETGAYLAVSSRSTRSCETLSVRYPGQVLSVPGNLTDSQAVREIGEQIARQWGALDQVIVNAGTAEYVDGQPADHTLIEHIVRSNLLAASFCLEVAMPLLRAGTEPHLVGIASPATYLPPSQIETGGSGMRHLFESARADLACAGVDVTLVHPGYDGPLLGPDDCFQTPIHWSADETARHVLDQLVERPREVALPIASMTALWPLPSSTETLPTDIGSSQAKNGYPIKGQP
ncbi:SDR family oxidoreductase [Pseudomonas brassicacearum]|uniref:SDR family NAD(P)-dependent oxidoreductase n=1 Tax=Pseudomonas TaxID=286 RepID=UPI00025FDC82|nr:MULTISPECIES: SDR family oxidoreductase [Pseudomonas]EIK57488.1 oxidoreductase, short chain dehydrogenase/reductase family [Pseudomonas fluorescens Q8r1-96]KIR17463.1 putative oxidoreductase [Pseudomonas fluorescens]ALQ05682.1 Oxidoreductase, short-chain dehydrogenase/reductase family [Pseudomonas brassicacearum]KAB0526860.1 SDR family oxidoreductase [Pseudomonas brassicacearum subsp. brassicacearum]NJP60596.1 SDR family oxidoreductase [Pseudomonas brassicacearum]